MAPLFLGKASSDEHRPGVDCLGLKASYDYSTPRETVLWSTSSWGRFLRTKSILRQTT